MERPAADTVRYLADYAALPLRPASVAGHAQRLGDLLSAVDEWDGLAFSFRAKEGAFTYVQVPVQYRPEWSEP